MGNEMNLGILYISHEFLTLLGILWENDTALNEIILYK